MVASDNTNDLWVIQEVDITFLKKKTSLQIHHVYSTLKRHGNGRFHVVSPWNPRGVFVGILNFFDNFINYLGPKCSSFLCV